MAAAPVTGISAAGAVPVRAVLTAGGRETAYARLGTGATVLLLRDNGEGDGAPSALFAALATRFRAIAPDRPRGLDVADGDAFGGWLRDFLDGLGVERASIVAEGALGPAVVEFAIEDAARVDRVVLLAEDGLVGVFDRRGARRLVDGDGGTPFNDVVRVLADGVEAQSASSATATAPATAKAKH